MLLQEQNNSWSNVCSPVKEKQTFTIFTLGRTENCDHGVGVPVSRLRPNDFWPGVKGRLEERIRVVSHYEKDRDFRERPPKRELGELSMMAILWETSVPGD